MSKLIDVRSAGGDLVVLGKALVLPASHSDGSDIPLDGSIRFNPMTVALEMCVGGVWRELGAGTGGGTGSGPFPITAVTGLETVLSNKATKVHVHPMSEVTGLLPALDTKTNIGHAHSLTDVVGLQPKLTSIDSTLSNKAALYHNHAITDVTGLSLALDARALMGHTHPIEQVVGLRPALNALAYERVPFCLSGKPTGGFKLAWTATQAVTFAAGFAGSRGAVLVNPTSDYTISIQKAGVLVGSITVNVVGAMAFVTIGTILVMAVGETLVFTCPPPDTTMETVSFTLVAAVN